VVVVPVPAGTELEVAGADVEDTGAAGALLDTAGADELLVVDGAVVVPQPAATAAATANGAHSRR
jgi:hypothetical protein